MSPKQMMICGSLAGAALSLALILTDHTNPVILFACGALFGKGYGVWEERSRKRGRAA